MKYVIKTRNIFVLIFALLGFQFASAQIFLADSSSILVNSALRSGVAMGVADMNGDGRDDIIRLDKASDLEIEYQHRDGSFTRLDYGNLSINDEWSLTIADFDENGLNDLMIGGNFNQIKKLTANEYGTGFSQVNLPPPLPNGQGIFMQAANFADINNDGLIDYFACNDVGINSNYRNDGAGVFVYDTSLINTKSVEPMVDPQPGNPNSGNYGSVWSDYDSDGDLDLYISKCSGGVFDAMDGRRVNILMQNDGSNNYTDVGESANMRPYAQSWSTAFGDLDNDGDMDAFIINHDSLSNFMYNNGDGTFTDVTDLTGTVNDLSFMGYGIQVIMEDFDNDGLLDVFVTGLNGTHLMLRNNGDTTYTDIDTALDTGGSGCQSAAAGDLNSDGFVDLIVGFAFGFNSPGNKNDKLLLNTGNSNHFLNMRLTGDSSNINGIGARIEVHHSSFGVQLREVRSGDSYGIQNSLARNFGLGSVTTVDSVIVRWPSGLVDKCVNVAADQFLEWEESSPCNCAGSTVRMVTNLTDSGTGSFRDQVLDACPNDTIRFDGALTGDTILLTTGEIILDKDLVIEGLSDGSIYVSGNLMHRIFTVEGANEIVLKDLNLIEAAGTAPSGAGILNKGYLVLVNVQMSGNTEGGVPKAIENRATLFVENGTVVVEN